MKSLEIIQQKKDEILSSLGTLKGKVFAAVSLAPAGALALTSTVFASGGSTTADFTPITSALTSSLNVAQIVAVIASGLGIGVGFFVMWWGARKLISVVQKSFKSGKISI